jgi:hypothetical protein
MLAHELLPARAAALRQFFRGRFGPHWRAVLSRRLEVPRWQCGATDKGVLRLEPVALSLGFKPVPTYEFPIPYQLNFLRKLDDVLYQLSLVPSAERTVTLGWLIEEWFQRKRTSRRYRSYLKSLVKSRSEGVKPGIENPPRKRGEAVRALLDLQIAGPPRPAQLYGGQVTDANRPIQWARAVNSLPPDFEI